MNRIKLSTISWWLAILWLVATGLVFVILFLQTVVGSMYHGHERELVAWFGAVLWPGTALVLGALAFTAFNSDQENMTVVARFLYLTFVLCTLYLFAVLASILLQLVVQEEPLTVLEGVKPWLLLFQGGAIAALGACFASAKRAHSANSIVCTPTFGRPTAPPKTADIFVVMPFAKELTPVYEDHIKAVANRLKLSVARADDFFGASPVVADIWNAIFSARVVIADCTGRNPNVFYEIGIAHTLGKPVVLAAQNAQDIPFDVQHIRSFTYEFTPKGMSKFEEMLTGVVNFEILQPRSLS